MEKDNLRAMLKEAVEPLLATKADSKILLLSCIDFRYPQRILETMDQEGHRDRYYHLALAGASHAAKHDQAWSRTFDDHLDFAVQHGRVAGVVILDHLDCKAYHLFEGIKPGDIEGERKKHREVVQGVIEAIVRRHATLRGKVRALLLPVEANPESIGQG